MTKRIGISHDAGNRYGHERYKRLKAIGFSCLDFSLMDTETQFYHDTQEKRDTLIIEEKRLINEAGLVVNQVHGPWRWPVSDGTDEERAERMEKMKWSIRHAALLGAKYWVIHPIMPFGTCECITNLGCEQETWGINLAFMKELLMTAKEYDVIICLENMPMPDFSLGSPKEILRFVKEMGDEHFKVCLDTGHVAVYEGQSVGDAIRLLDDEIRVIHVHDNDGKQDLHLFPYKGIIDWDDVGKALKDIDYKGVFNYETHPSHECSDTDYEQGLLQMIQIAEQILK